MFAALAGVWVLQCGLSVLNPGVCPPENPAPPLPVAYTDAGGLHDADWLGSAVLSVAVQASALKISYLSPRSGPLGTTVTIVGAGFGASNDVYFDNGSRHYKIGSPVASEDGRTLRFQVSTCPSTVPQCPGFYLRPGAYKVSVVTGAHTSNEVNFTVIPPR